MTISYEVALLAPVPFEHLKSGENKCGEKGKVAFGSMAWEVFRELDRIRNGLKVPVYLYASHNEEEAPRVPIVSWQALYIGHCDSVMGKHPDDMEYRPASAITDIDTWAVFWEVEDLHQISEGPGRLLRSQFVSYKGGKKLAKNFVPLGPVLIKHRF
jgi:hypothetical protein